MVDDAPPRFVFRSDHQIGLVVGEQGERIGMKSGHQIELDLRPVLAKRVHDRHQPVETGVAFERDAQRPRGLSGELGEIALRGLDLAHHSAAQRHQPPPRLGQLHGLPVTFHHRQAVMRLQRLQLMRKSRLGQMHALGGARYRARLGERDQRAEVADFEH